MVAPGNYLGQPGKKRSKSKSDKLLKTNEMAPLPPFAQDRKALDNEEIFDPEVMTVSDVLRMIEKYRKMHDNVERQLDYIYQRTGLSPKQIEDYLSNPNNFTHMEWEKIKREHEAFEHSFKVKKNKETSSPNKIENVKERKTKTMGSRRNWIPVR